MKNKDNSFEVSRSTWGNGFVGYKSTRQNSLVINYKALPKLPDEKMFEEMFKGGMVVWSKFRRVGTSNRNVALTSGVLAKSKKKVKGILKGLTAEGKYPV